MMSDMFEGVFYLMFVLFFVDGFWDFSDYGFKIYFGFVVGIL